MVQFTLIAFLWIQKLFEPIKWSTEFSGKLYNHSFFGMVQFALILHLPMVQFALILHLPIRSLSNNHQAKIPFTLAPSLFHHLAKAFTAPLHNCICLFKSATGLELSEKCTDMPMRKGCQDGYHTTIELQLAFSFKTQMLKTMQQQM